MTQRFQLSAQQHRRSKRLCAVLVVLFLVNVWLLVVEVPTWLQSPQIQASVRNLVPAWVLGAFVLLVVIVLGWQVLLLLFEVVDIRVDAGEIVVVRLVGKASRLQISGGIRAWRVRLIGFEESKLVRGGALLWIAGSPMVLTETMEGYETLLALLVKGDR